MNSRVSPPDSAGALLQRERIAQGKSLEQLVAATRLTRQRLEGLERGEFEGRSEQVFALGYVRLYARALGLDPAPFEAALRAQHQPVVAESPPPPKPKSVLQRYWRIWLILWLGLLGAALQLAPMVVAPPGQKQKLPYEELTLPAPYNLSNVLPTPARIPVAPAAETALRELSIAVTGNCWTDIADAKGRRLVAQLLQSGDNLALLGEPPFRVRLGNPAVAELFFDGERVLLPPQRGGRMMRLTVGEVTTAAEP